MEIIKRRNLYFVLLLIVIGTLNIGKIHSQVTIGSNATTNKGAILDLKEDGEQGKNSTKGLLLPRVNLEKATILPPLSTTYGGSNPELVHTGLWVYNMNNTFTYATRNNDDNVCEGPYSWDGSRWIRLFPDCLCEYAIEGRQDEGGGKKTYWFLCQDFEDISQADARNVCKSVSQNKRKYHLMTYEEYEQIWSEPVLDTSPSEYSFIPDANYFVHKKSDVENPQGWITIGFQKDNSTNPREVLGFNRADAHPTDIPNNIYFPGGMPIGAELAKNIVRCVRDY